MPRINVGDTVIYAGNDEGRVVSRNFIGRVGIVVRFAGYGWYNVMWNDGNISFGLLEQNLRPYPIQPPPPPLDVSATLTKMLSKRKEKPNAQP